MKIPERRRIFPKYLVGLLVGMLVIGPVGIFMAMQHGRELSNTLSFVAGEKAVPFPSVSTSELSPQGSKLVTILRSEYAAQPTGTKYSEGVGEPWCADFVSWVMREASEPLANPNSGSWRIPGVYTLRDYFVSRGNWHAYGDGYQPKFGDIAIYDGNGPFGQHTNFIVRNDNGLLTTIGGNEVGKIRIQQHQLNDSLKVLGFAEQTVLRSTTE